MKIPPSLRRKMAKYPVFTQKVWEACAAIPRGETRTYQWIARKIKRPQAARAVGNALGMNPFAPVIPCHRVVRSDGKMGGYSGSGGKKRKKALLMREGALKN